MKNNKHEEKVLEKAILTRIAEVDEEVSYVHVGSALETVTSLTQRTVFHENLSDTPITI